MIIFLASAQSRYINVLEYDNLKEEKGSENRKTLLKIQSVLLFLGLST